HNGMAPREAAIEAAGLRLRAIVMTSFAFILGCVPLAIASGPGANSLRAIGTGVIGGMLFSTLIAIFFVPLFFWFLESMSQRFGGAKAHGGAATKASAHEKRKGDRSEDRGIVPRGRGASFGVRGGTRLQAPGDRFAQGLAHRVSEGSRGREHQV